MVERAVAADATNLTTVTERDQVDALVPDVANHPLRPVLDAGAGIVAAGVHGVADQDAVLPHPQRERPGVQLTVMDASLLDGVVDRVRLAVGAGNERQSLAAGVPIEERCNHGVACFLRAGDPLHVPAFE